MAGLMKIFLLPWCLFSPLYFLHCKHWSYRRRASIGEGAPPLVGVISPSPREDYLAHMMRS